jgi:DNA-binding response OmpR family regulator
MRDSGSSSLGHWRTKASALAQNLDLIVLDLTLPGMDGRTVLQRLVDERPERQVLVVSALPDIGTRLAVLAAGAADFLGKQSPAPRAFPGRGSRAIGRRGAGRWCGRR